MGYYRDPIFPLDVLVSIQLWLLVVIIFARLIYFGNLVNP